LPFNVVDRNYPLPISITGATTTIISIDQDNSTQNSTFSNSTIIIPIPDDNTSFVEVL
jgi:hypothetical protein